MTPDSIIKNVGKINVDCTDSNLSTVLTKRVDENSILVFDFEVNSKTELFPQPITLSWKIPAINVKGVWKPTADFSKRIHADWELEHMESRISIDAPVIALFGHDDTNILTFSCSDAIHKLEMNARIREEDNHFYCHITFFTEYEQAITNFKTQIRLDYRDSHFSKSLIDVSKWWETFENLTPTHVPDIARKPLYSTWYQFHQNLDENTLLKECKLAYGMGYEAIIIDDGWQTNDNNRGYDYTGDWQPERIPEMSAFVDRIHELGMKVALWYSVPFCGKKSKAYQLFKGKFLTENHRWAPVFDPRFPEVREYLIAIYANALKDWKLDGFKLDFIDDFRLYEDTPLNQENGRDFASINEAVDQLMTDVSKALQAINPDVFIEFRQKYIGPAMRKYGNMLRAFDCPGDAVMNRIRIADIRMLGGDSAIHSDMVTWHHDEKVEIAALQIINILFGVPQLSIMINEASVEHTKMIRFYTNYWNENAIVLMEGDFIPSSPLANYPTQRVTKEDHTIIGVYEEMITNLDSAAKVIHIHNGQLAPNIVLRNVSDFGAYTCKIYDCMGHIVSNSTVDFSVGLLELTVPPCGILIAKKV